MSAARTTAQATVMPWAMLLGQTVPTPWGNEQWHGAGPEVCPWYNDRQAYSVYTNSFSDLYSDSLDWPRGGNLYIDSKVYSGPNRSSAATSYTKTPGCPCMSRCHLYSLLFELRRIMQPFTFNKDILKVQFLILLSTPTHPLPTTNQNQSSREVRNILVWKWKHFPPLSWE